MVPFAAIPHRIEIAHDRRRVSEPDLLVMHGGILWNRSIDAAPGRVPSAPPPIATSSPRPSPNSAALAIDYRDRSFGGQRRQFDTAKTAPPS